MPHPADIPRAHKGGCAETGKRVSGNSTRAQNVIQTGGTVMHTKCNREALAKCEGGGLWRVVDGVVEWCGVPWRVVEGCGGL